MAERLLRTGCLDWPPRGTYFDAPPMRVEEVEDDDGLVVRAELPGLDCRRDLDVLVRGHLLEIRAERTPKQSEAHERNRRSEFQYGRSWRILSLPRAARESEVVATYGDGILEVRVPLDDIDHPEGTRIAVAPRDEERS